MFYYDRIGVSEKIDVNKTNKSRKTIVCNQNYFLKEICGFQPNVCDAYYDLMQKATSFNDVAIVPAQGNDHRIHFWCMSKDGSYKYNEKF